MADGTFEWCFFGATGRHPLSLYVNKLKCCCCRELLVSSTLRNMCFTMRSVNDDNFHSWVNYPLYIPPINLTVSACSSPAPVGKCTVRWGKCVSDPFWAQRERERACRVTDGEGQASGTRGQSGINLLHSFTATSSLTPSSLCPDEDTATSLPLFSHPWEPRVRIHSRTIQCQPCTTTQTPTDSLWPLNSWTGSYEGLWGTSTWREAAWGHRLASIYADLRIMNSNESRLQLVIKLSILCLQLLD